jgi:tRNA-2-methylthio-N6-dimethylallyladenosine synthase
MARSYVVRTFGCQMNEHDSERIAGLLEDDGLVQAASVDDADVVVLNTCCIRENADNKLYGNLGQLKRWKEGRDGRQIVVAGCLAQKDRESVRERAPQVDVVLGTHNVHRTAALVGEARSPRSSTRRCSTTTRSSPPPCPSVATPATARG